MFRVLPRNKELDELWVAGLLFSRANDTPEHFEWAEDSYHEHVLPPTRSSEQWEFAIQVED